MHKTRLIARQLAFNFPSKFYSKIIPDVHDIIIPSVFRLIGTNGSFKYHRQLSHARNGPESLIEKLAIKQKNKGHLLSSRILEVAQNLDEDLKDEKKQFLLECCCYAIPDNIVQSRIILVNKIWTMLQDQNINLDLGCYNMYLHLCIENNMKIEFEEFLLKMRSQANEETYILLLEAVCQYGDIHQAVKIVALMKEKGIPANERLFNMLVLAHTINGGLEGAQNIIKTMNTIHIPITSATHNEIIRGLAMHSNYEEFLNYFSEYVAAVEEKNLLKLFKILSVKQNLTWLDDLKKIVGPRQFSKQYMPQLNLLCIDLIYSKQPEIAIQIYKNFSECNSFLNEGKFAFFLLEQLLYSNTPINSIIKIVEDLKENNLNPLALEKVTELALRRTCSSTALLLLNKFTLLRPHYFWPLFLQMHEKNGENGIMEILKNMKELNVKLDEDTWEYYCISLFDLTNPKELILRLQSLGFTVRELLSPVIATLLRQNRVIHARNLCYLYDVPLHRERLLQPLVNAWSTSEDAENIIKILQIICKSSKVNDDYAGRFLIRSLKKCKPPITCKPFLQLLQEMHRKNFKISIAVADSLTYWLKTPQYQTKLYQNMQEEMDNLINASVNSRILHPREMTIPELEAHLIELENKGMETRGTMRRLIQAYCRLGDEARVHSLREKYIEAGYEETMGMKSSLFYTYVLSQNFKSAMSLYKQMKKLETTFVIDEYKILDLATLMVHNNEFNAAIKLLNDESVNRKIIGGPEIVRNCWKLITSTNEENQIEQIFNLLVDKGYCVPNNILLGPLVKIHLVQNNLEKAVQVFREYAEKYNCTPIQLEMVSALINNENEELLQKVLNIVAKVHGSDAATISFIAALAENSCNKILRKFLTETPAIAPKQFAMRCERWVKENKIHALQTLLQASEKMKTNVFDRSIVFDCIMNIYSINNDCDAAVTFYREALKREENLPKTMINNLLRLVERSKYVLPQDLSIKEFN